MATASMCDACKAVAPMQNNVAYPVGWVLVRVVPTFDDYMAAHMAGKNVHDDVVFCGAKCAITFLMTNEGITV